MSIQKNILSGEGKDVICKCGKFCNKRICPCYNVLCDDGKYRECLDDCECKCCG